MAYKIARPVGKDYIPLSDALEKRLDAEWRAENSPIKTPGVAGGKYKLQDGKGKGKGWREPADHTGKAPRHKEVARTTKLKDTLRTPMSKPKKEKDWKQTAKKELEKILDVKTEESTYGYFEGLGALALKSITGRGDNGESEWIVFKDYDAAKHAALAVVRDDLQTEPELFKASWLQNFMKISDADRSMIAGQEADNYVGDQLSQDEIIDKADMGFEWDEAGDKIFNLEDPTGLDKEDYDKLVKEQTSILGKAKEKVRMEKHSEIYNALLDPIRYFVEDHGMYTRNELMKQSFIHIDVEKAAENAIKEGGAAYYLDKYDGSAKELPSGAMAYGTN